MHTAARQVIERVLGITWHYRLFDFNLQFGVCGEASDGRRQAVRFEIPRKDVIITNVDHVLRFHVDKVDAAKTRVIELFMEGKYVADGDTMEGAETKMTSDQETHA